MRIARVWIENFRNFRSLDVALDRHAVIVDENKVGKSNFLLRSGSFSTQASRDLLGKRVPKPPTSCGPTLSSSYGWR